MMRLSKLFGGKLEILHRGSPASGCAVIVHLKVVHSVAVALSGSTMHLNALADFMHSDVQSCRVSLFLSMEPCWLEAIVGLLSPNPLYAA